MSGGTDADGKPDGGMGPCGHPPGLKKRVLIRPAFTTLQPRLCRENSRAIKK